jgi:hypothetical protein
MIGFQEMDKQHKKTRNRLTKAQSTMVCEVFAVNDGKWDKVSTWAYFTISHLKRSWQTIESRN